MPKFRVTGTVAASVYLGESEADTPEKAIEMALDSDAASITLCHQCSNQMSDPEVEDATAEMVE